jgi:hypothetical protein
VLVVETVVDDTLDAGKVVFEEKPIRDPKLLLSVVSCGTRFDATGNEPTPAAPHVPVEPYVYPVGKAVGIV